jgi:S1-C subfamily serine protease
VLTPLEAAPCIVLLEFQKSYGLGFVAPNGRIVTSFHVVADEREIVAHLADGRAIPVKRVAAVDSRRDLAVLDVGVLDAPPVRPPASSLSDEGTPVYAFGMVASEGRIRWVEAQVSAVQVLGSTLTVYRLEGEVPSDASGGPLVAEDGTTLGVVTVAESDEGLITLAVPWRYVGPLLLQSHELPLSALSLTERKAPRREVPSHPLTLLDGSSSAGLEAATEVIAGAIRVGAPAYNEGDVERCYRIYVDAARRLIDLRRDCPGVQVALQAGLARAEALQDVDHRAWAMRDAFDGLLGVIEKFMKARAGPGVRGRPRPTFLN